MSRDEKIAIIRDFVPRLRALIAGLNPEQLTIQYNPPEWTIAQNIHHLVDAHINSYLRFKLMLTADNPTLPRIDPQHFAVMPDGTDGHVADSLLILGGIHARWARMMEQTTDWDRTGYYPKLDLTFTLDSLLDSYSRHSNAHYQQIQEVIAKIPDAERPA